MILTISILASLGAVVICWTLIAFAQGFLRGYRASVERRKARRALQEWHDAIQQMGIGKRDVEPRNGNGA